MATDQLLDLIDGMTQAERRIQALDPAYIKPDDRDLPELLRYMTHIASQVNFYNEKNEVDGDWVDFFKSDVNVLVALITKFDLTGHLTRYEKLETAIQLATSSRETIQAMRDLFAFLAEISTHLADTSERLQGGTIYNKTAAELGSLIDGFSGEVSKLAAYNRQAEAIFGDWVGVDFPEYGFNPDVEPPEPIFTVRGALNEQALSGLAPLKKAFDAIRSGYNNFLAVTSTYYKDHDITEQEYHPHLALCVTFLHLYTYLQEQLNQLPAQHLDLYYKTILGLHPKGAEPDALHVVFDPATLQRVDLGEGEVIQADAGGKQHFYALDDELTVTRAQIAELKTLYLDEHTQMFSPDPDYRDITEVEVYKSTYSPVAANAFFKQKETLRSWPLFGESQYELADEDRTMEDADIGILLASPVLYQTDGHRALTLKIYFEHSSFSQLINYFNNFAKVTGKQLQSVSYELLSDAFVISFTSAAGWEEVKWYSVIVYTSDGSLEIRFELSPVDPAIGLYDPLLHGDNHDISWPVVKLLLNNYSTHNPFSFFRRLLIDRVTVTADVKGSRALKLQNNVGSLSADNPFQPFGPQPTVGSYLDIRNTNIFNRFTKGFCIRLEWIDLPGDPGGWETYYKEYGADITNDSFKVKISGLSQGKFKPAPSRRQEFTLFSTTRNEVGAEILDANSEIKNVDVKKLELPNKPLLNAEEESDGNFNEGAVRIEFSAPQEAFGSRIYPQIFPDAVIHNSKRFATKRKLPNPPYIPIVRSITVDYTVEHSEVLLKNAKNEDSALKLIHQYPFGYEALYPESDKQPYPFVPAFDYGNNLYIGLNELLPEQELSLFFQLEEKNFSDTARDPEPVTWSYLYKDSWIDLGKNEVLYDTTMNFITSGIVKLRLPADVQKGNTTFSSSLYWLRAACDGKVNLKARLTGVYPHAVTATRVLTDGSEMDGQVLPPNSITGLRSAIPGITGVHQLTPSHGGKARETLEDYRIRVSERLRHKNRLVTNRDIEQAILNEFPELLMAKSISPEPPGPGEYRPADNKIRIIIVPKAHYGVAENGRPKVNLALLYRIKTFVKRSISPFVDLEVENPVYEKIKLLGKIRFNYKKSTDNGLYLQRLNADLKRFICPWQYEASSTFKIGSQIYLAELVNFIKKRPYVDYVTGFSVLHFYHWLNTETGELLSGVNDFGHGLKNAVRGSVPEAVLVPAEDHEFTVMEEIEYEEPPEIGIGNLSIGDELLVYDDDLSSDDDGRTTNDRSFTDENEYFSLFINHNIN